MIPIPLVSALLTIAGGSGPAPAAMPATGLAGMPPSARTAADRAIAFGLFVDSPPPDGVLDEAISIAERLPRVYGIDSGDVLADRAAAARRAAAFLGRLVFRESELIRAARDLGYDLQPGTCRATCRDIRALAEVELRKRALLSLVTPERPPGTER